MGVDHYVEEKAYTKTFAELKSGGFIKQKQKDLYTVRLRCPGGMIPAEWLPKIAEVAKTYGRGVVHTSVRMSIEIPYVNIKDFDKVIKELETVGIKIASCGPRVRVPIACGGCEYNPNGLTDTQKLCKEADKRYFGTPTHHKFKISFSGCPIDCMRTRESDLGFQGIVEPAWDENSCTGCTLCAKVCQEGAIVSREEDGKPIYDPSKCIYCGDCIRVCPTESWTAKRTGHLVRVGGKHGRHPLEAEEVAKFVTDEEVFPVLEKTLEWYKSNGKRGERIGKTIRRVGIQSYKEAVFGYKETQGLGEPA